MSNSTADHIASQASLTVQQGHKVKDPFHLVPGHTVTVGRAPGNDLVLHDDVCSRQHCEIFAGENGWILRDLASRNGTTVDGVPVRSDWELENGQRILIGGCEILVTIVGNDKPREGDTAWADAPEILHRTKESRLLQDSPESVADPRLSSELAWLYRCGLEMGNAQNASELCQFALTNLQQRLKAEIGAILLLPEPKPAGKADAEQLSVAAHTGTADAAYRPVSTRVSRLVLEAEEGVLTADIEDDSRLSQSDSLGQFQVRSVVCAPIRDHKLLYGVIHFYGSERSRPLTKESLDVVLAVGDQLAIGLHKITERESLTLAAARYRHENQHLRRQLELDAQLVGQSTAVRQLRETISRIAPTDATALIRGESGVGKELVARAIHDQSDRRNGPFICMNCAALSETLLESELFGHEKGSFTGAVGRKPGKFEQAHEGTLFLDEVGEMGLTIQAKFLRVLEGHPFERVGGNAFVNVDVRVVSATNRDLEDAVAAGEFRRDLYFRLHVVEINVVALRDRQPDIPLLARYFLERSAKKTGRDVQGFSGAAMELLMKYDWPGNVRELQNAVERAVILCQGEEVAAADVKLSGLSVGEEQPSASAGQSSAGGYREISLEQLEREHILETLEQTGWNKSHASQILGIERSTLDRKLKRYNVQRP